MSELIKPAVAIQFLRSASVYFQTRALLGGEDVTNQAHMANARVCERIAELVGSRLIDQATQSEKSE